MHYIYIYIYIYIFLIIHLRCIREVFSDVLSSLPISGYFCVISAPTVTPVWLWKSQTASVIATCYARASTKAKKKLIRPDFSRSYRHIYIRICVCACVFEKRERERERERERDGKLIQSDWMYVLSKDTKGKYTQKHQYYQTKIDDAKRIRIKEFKKLLLSAHQT